MKSSVSRCTCMLALENVLRTLLRGTAKSIHISKRCPAQGWRSLKQIQNRARISACLFLCSLNLFSLALPRRDTLYLLSIKLTCPDKEINYRIILSWQRLQIAVRVAGADSCDRKRNDGYGNKNGDYGRIRTSWASFLPRTA